MSESFSFLKSNRSKIGLVDIYDLGEIYNDSQRDALKNIFLDPDGLDQISGLSKEGISKEDIRTMGGLDKPVITSLSISDEMNRAVSYDISRHLRTNSDIGEPSKHSFSSNVYSDNLVIFHGGIAANSIEYNFIDETGAVRTTSVPTSRESLFNSTKDNSGRVTLAEYPSLFRIRRRSHINQIKLNESMLIQRETIVESPTNTLNVPVYMATTTTPNPAVSLLQCYATKNSPLILPVKIASSTTIKIGRVGPSASSFVFGWELKRASDGLLIRSGVINSSNVTEVSISISVTGTLGQNVDCRLFLYLDPSQVTSLDLTGLGIQEQSGEDIGLIGFNSLKTLILRNNRLSTYPVWLKTLNTTLEYLDISGNTFWNNGIVRYFDYQDMRGTGINGRNDLAPPSISASQVLCYSGKTSSGDIPGYEGTLSTVRDLSNKLMVNGRKDSLPTSGTTAYTSSSANGFRVFSNLKQLIVGSSVSFVNADFSKLFPKLENFVANTNGNSPRELIGLLPKFRNENQPITVNYVDQTNLGGTINYMGSTLRWTSTENSDINSADSAQFIGRFKVKGFEAWNTRIRGGFFTANGDTADNVNGSHVDNASHIANAWAGWLTNLSTLNLGWYTNAYVKIANGSLLNWQVLSYVMLNHSWENDSSTRVTYNIGLSQSSYDSNDVLTGPSISQVHAWRSGWGGRVFSVDGAKSLIIANLGGNDWVGYGDRADGFRYLLPDNFVTSDGNHNLSQLYLHYILNGEAKKLVLRPDSFKNTKSLSVFDSTDSRIFGKFPDIYNDGQAANIVMNYIAVSGCNFRDISPLGSSKTSRIRSLYFTGMGPSVGGCMLPSFVSSSSNTTLVNVYGEGSLSSSYPTTWKPASGTPGRVISSLFSDTPEENSGPPGATWIRDPSATDEDVNERILIVPSSNSVPLRDYIMVGDQIVYNDTVIGRVTQLDINNKYIYAIGDGIVTLPDSTTLGSGVGLLFRRAGQDISNFFTRHTALYAVSLGNNRITGSVPNFTGCNKVFLVDFNNNLLTNYVKGTLSREGLLGQSGAVALSTFNLSNNPLSKESVRRIIEDCFNFVSTSGNRSYNININLLNTKYDPITKTFTKWSRSEIFDGATTVTLPPAEEGESPITQIIPDPLESNFNRMGAGQTYPFMKISLF